MPVDWSSEISRQIGAERERTLALLGDLVAEIQDAQADDLELATRSLVVELADLKATLAELRVVLAPEKSRGIIDLPNLLSRVN